MLHGSIMKPLFMFAIPVAFIGILQQMFNTVDILILGRFVGPETLAAVGNNAPVIGILVNLFLGISLGSNVVIAKLLGGRHLREASDAIHTALLLAVITGTLIMIVGELFSGPIMEWMGVPMEVRDESELYLRIFLLGMPGMTLYDFTSAIYRSRGNVRTPFMTLLTASIFNLIADIVVVALGGGLAGVVGTTVLSNYVSSGLLVYMLYEGHGILQLIPGALHLHGEYVHEILRIGIPAGIQGMVFSLSNLVIQAAINSEGALAMAASAAAYVIEMNTYPFLVAFGQAITTFVSQNYGAGNLPRCYAIAKRGFILNLLFISALSVAVFLGAPLFFTFFDLNEEGFGLALLRIHLIVGFYFLCAGYESYSAALRGFGNSLMPAIAMLISICGVRIVWIATVYAAMPTFRNIMYCYAASWVAADILIAFIYLRYRPKTLEQPLS